MDKPGFDCPTASGTPAASIGLLLRDLNDNNLRLPLGGWPQDAPYAIRAASVFSLLGTFLCSIPSVAIPPSGKRLKGPFAPQEICV